MSPVAWIAGLLVALGAGAAGYLALRSRRKDEYEDAYDIEPARIFVEPELPLPAYAVAEDVTAEPAPRAIESNPHPTVAEPIGSEEADGREGRDAALDRMVSASPDAENPFTSPKGRLRRAKLILQAREQDQKEAESQPFDWRTFGSSTSNPAPATPPRVTV